VKHPRRRGALGEDERPRPHAPGADSKNECEATVSKEDWRAAETWRSTHAADDTGESRNGEWFLVPGSVVHSDGTAHATLRSRVMRRLRQHLSIVLLGWLFVQLTACAAPVVLAAAFGAPAEELCTCASGDHETCPMHHGSSQGGAGTCAMRGTCTPTDIALLSMSAVAGVLPQGIAVGPADRSTLLSFSDSEPLTIPVLPDSPPPRS
jgi:hypothetical protein